MAANGTFLCSDCEGLERLEAGYDPALGRFIWQCKYCTRSYEEDDEHGAHPSPRPAPPPTSSPTFRLRHRRHPTAAAQSDADHEHQRNT